MTKIIHKNIKKHQCKFNKIYLNRLKNSYNSIIINK